MIKIKPLSINKAWQGKRFKSNAYKAYEIELLLKLPTLSVSKDKLLGIEIMVYFKNKASDIDNVLKPMLDIMQKKYGFDDNQIYHLTICKVISNNEGFDFNIFEL